MQTYQITCSGHQRKEVLSHFSSDMKLVAEYPTYIVFKSDTDWQALREYFKEYGVIVGEAVWDV